MEEVKKHLRIYATINYSITCDIDIPETMRDKTNKEIKKFIQKEAFDIIDETEIYSSEVDIHCIDEEGSIILTKKLKTIMEVG